MKRKIAGLATSLLLLSFSPVLLTYWVHEEMERRMKIQASGKLVPHAFSPAYSLRNANFLWRNRVRLTSGNLEFRYDPFSFMTSGRLKLKIQGHDLSLELLEDWARSQGAANVEAERFEAEIGLSQEGIEEIYSVDLVSPTFQFHIKKTEK